ncbi:MAG: hypothetical protein F6K00_07125 [Leptolyngbya sp. SIOISBB]|nr:hypothetical protein [Leptolyngbya sp. SIOISBB]
MSAFKPAANIAEQAIELFHQQSTDGWLVPTIGLVSKKANSPSHSKFGIPITYFGHDTLQLAMLPIFEVSVCVF